MKSISKAGNALAWVLAIFLAVGFLGFGGVKAINSPVSAGSGGAVGQTIVVCRLSSLARTQGGQTTENDGPPHEPAGTQPR